MLNRDRDFLTGKEIHALMRAELERELTRTVASSYDDDAYAPYTAKISRIVAAAYDVARRPERPTKLTEEDEQFLLAKGFDEVEFEFIEQDLAERCYSDELDDDHVRGRLEAIGAPVSPVSIQRARPVLMRARWEAHLRAMRMDDPRVRNALDPVETLMGPEFTPEEIAATSPASPTPPSPAPVPVQAPVDEGLASQFVIFDHRRFSEIIDDVVEHLKEEGTWSGDCRQQKQIARAFAWITGDKKLGDYNHLDVEAFKRSLLHLPRTFRYTNFLSRPFHEVVGSLPSMKAEDKRSPKTINRDLAFMSTIARQLAQSAWKPRWPGAVVLDFSAATIPVKDDGIDPRPPWTREHMERLFHSPIWTGGIGPKERLLEGGVGVIYHDAAYWAPLFWYYQHARREEICGLRVDEIILDHAVPYFRIKDNDVRGRDGELAGEKTQASKRDLPLHPELLRLGFADYVRAIRREGHAALFPELYVNRAKRGGSQFYYIAWRFMVDWIEDRMEVPVNPKGKGPDIHSIRALGSSFYEIDGVNEIVRADIMGHARTGTNGKHYSKRLVTEGLDVVLPERRAFLEKYVPVITGDLPAAKLNMLPIELRSRVGSGRHRKMRSDKGVRRSGDS